MSTGQQPPSVNQFIPHNRFEEYVLSALQGLTQQISDMAEKRPAGPQSVSLQPGAAGAYAANVHSTHAPMPTTAAAHPAATDGGHDRAYPMAQEPRAVVAAVQPAAQSVDNAGQGVEHPGQQAMTAGPQHPGAMAHPQAHPQSLPQGPGGEPLSQTALQQAQQALQTQQALQIQQAQQAPQAPQAPQPSDGVGDHAGTGTAG